MAHKAYGYAHQQKATQLKRAALGQPCPICGGPMLAGHQLDLDHTDPQAKALGLPGDRVTHATCNRSEGGTRGAHITNTQQRHTITREW